MIYSLNTKEVSELSQIGGKAKALIETTRAGFKVPPGIVLAVDFFTPWIESLKSTKEWEAFLASPTKEHCDTLKTEAGKLTFSDTQKKGVEKALADMPETTIFAVRSSSPEEDLVETSFAGQYDTLLGVTADKIESAVVLAFVSMLDTRVVEYKKQNNLPIDNPRIAVIIQKMVKADVSGIAFSLNPNNNAYDEAMISAGFGLGETIVAGKVTPDTYIVEKVKNEILEKKIAAKEIGLWLNDDGGTVEKPNDDPKAQALTDDQIFAVARLAADCEKNYGKPMDIEWAIENGELFLLQSRPITTYIQFYPEMLTEPGERKNIYLDMTVLTQGFSEPFSVMGLEIWTKLLNGVKMGTMPPGKDGILFNVHGKQYLHISNWVKGLGEKMLSPLIVNYELPVREIFKTIDLKKEYMPRVKTEKMKKVVNETMKSALAVVPGMIGGIINPKKGKKKYEEFARATYHYLDQELPEELSLSQIIDQALIQFLGLTKNMAFYIAAQLAHAKIQKIFKGKGVDDLILTLSMDLPNNPTSAMGHFMLKLASYDDIQKTATEEEFIKKLEDRSYSADFLRDYEEFMAKYGARGFKEVDIATPRTSEKPGEFFKQLKAINIDNNHIQNIKKRKEEGYRKLREAAKEIGKEKQFLNAADTYMSLWGYREEPKFMFVIFTGKLRKRALEMGTAFVNQNRLERREQIFDLTLAQAEEAERNPDLDLLSLVEKNIAPRRALEYLTDWPKVVDSRGKIFRYAGKTEEGDLVGEPIAPGTVRGKAKVLHSPYEKKLEEGEILVARATEPAWTPIFVNAVGVVLEIGGPLQHGAIIAREYGIPCVSGIEGVMEIIKDGDLLEVNGSGGIVKIVAAEKG